MTAAESSSRDAPAASARHSLFFRLLAIMLGAVLITLIVLGFFFRSIWNPETHETTTRNLQHYAELLSREIGTPPDTARAGQLSRKLLLGIAIRYPDTTWWNSPYVTEGVRERAESGELPDTTVQARLVRGGRMLAVVSHNGYSFVYGSRRRQPMEIQSQDWFILLGAIVAISLVAWLLLRRQLYPVRTLAQGVRDVDGGNLDAHVPEGGTHEFAGLARSFNAMTRNLKERLQARDQLLLDVSHELRSPLTRMRVALEMAAPGAAVDSLREEVDSLEKMVSEILETERLHSVRGGLKLETGDLNAVIHEKIEGFEGQSPGIQWEKSALPPIRMDTERMRLVLRNLIENALKYGKAANRPVEIAARLSGQTVLLEVRDWGPGVPPQEQGLVFEPFYRTDRSRTQAPGYGLGLPLCRRIVEAHGGTISFASAPGEPTRVTIRLPAG